MGWNKSHSKDHIEAGEPGLNATHIEKKMKEKKRKFFSVKKAFACTLVGAFCSWGNVEYSMGNPWRSSQGDQDVDVHHSWSGLVEEAAQADTSCTFTILIPCWHCPVSLRCCTLWVETASQWGQGGQKPAWMFCCTSHTSCSGPGCSFTWAGGWAVPQVTAAESTFRHRYLLGFLSSLCLGNEKTQRG